MKRLAIGCLAVGSLLLAYSALADDDYLQTVTGTSGAVGISTSLCSRSSGCEYLQFMAQCDANARYRTCEGYPVQTAILADGGYVATDGGLLQWDGGYGACQPSATTGSVFIGGKQADFKLRHGRKILSVIAEDAGTVNCLIFNVNPATLP